MRQFHKLHDVKLFGRIEHIDQIMRNAAHLLRADFGRSDIHMAVDLHGIRGDNGPIHRFGKRNRQLRLTDSGRTGQDNQRFFQKNHLHNSLKFLFQFPYLAGECTLEEAVYIIKRDTRHFAKRQLTWFRREKDVIWLNKPDFDYDEEKILSYMLDRWNEIVSADAKEEGEQSC